MGMQDYYSIKAFYRCRRLLLPSDTDRIVFVNNESNRWADGTPLSVDDMIGFLEYYGRDQRKPRDQRVFRSTIGFVDGEGMDYGHAVRFDSEGRPLVEVVDGRICASAPVRRFSFGDVEEDEHFLRDLFEELSASYELAWASAEHDSFFVYFHGAGERDYRIYVSCDYVDIACRRRLFCWTWWESFTHEHHDADGDDVMGVGSTVKYYLRSYGAVS